MSADSPSDAALRNAHDALLAEIALEAQDTASWTGRAQFSKAVMAAMKHVRRDAFLPAEHRLSAYRNRPQPIGFGQTISQPYMVALMSDLLDIQPTDRILEIGTGSGYQTAVLAELAAEVYSLETIEALSLAARERLDAMGYNNVHLRCADGALGWAEASPFDGIMVTAAAASVPQALVSQLRPGGRLVIPTGPAFGPQMLKLGILQKNGKIAMSPVIPVAFVPLVQPRAK